MKLILASLFTIFVVPAGIVTFARATSSNEDVRTRTPQNIKENVKIKELLKTEEGPSEEEPVGT